MPNYHASPRLITSLLLFSLIFSCKENPSFFTSKEAATVTESVQKLANNTARDITNKGPIAWLDYFEDTPDFFMASDGGIAFKNYHSADIFIRNTLVKQIPKISLKWSNMRIDALTSRVAVVGANFHEDLTDITGKVIPVDGYFTATACQTSKGWKYHNVHWSMKHVK